MADTFEAGVEPQEGKIPDKRKKSPGRKPKAKSKPESLWAKIKAYGKKMAGQFKEPSPVAIEKNRELIETKINPRIAANYHKAIPHPAIPRLVVFQGEVLDAMAEMMAVIREESHIDQATKALAFLGPLSKIGQGLYAVGSHLSRLQDLKKQFAAQPDNVAKWLDEQWHLMQAQQTAQSVNAYIDPSPRWRETTPTPGQDDAEVRSHDSGE